MKKILHIMVALLFACSTLAMAGCDEEDEYLEDDADVTAEPGPEPEPSTAVSENGEEDESAGVNQQDILRDKGKQSPGPH